MTTSMVSPIARAAVVLLALSLPVAARADVTLTRARAHFEAGRAHYALGDYAQAIQEFTAGYQLVHKPEFLINLGQSFRRLNELDAARAKFEQFLAEAPTDDPYRPQARALIDEIDRAKAERTAPEPAPPVRQAPPTPPPRVASPPPSS